MPRLSQAIPRYRKHKASGQAIVEINGRRHYLGPHGTRVSRLEYDRLITEWLSSGRAQSFGVRGEPLSIAEVLLEYLTYAKEYYGGGGRTEYTNMLQAVKPLQRLYGQRPAAEFDGPRLKAVRQVYVDAGHCRAYVNASTNRVVRVFRWAAGEGLVPAEVPVALSMVPGLRRGRTAAPEGRKVRPVGSQIVATTLPHLSRVLQAMVSLQQLTGMRPNELCMLRPADVERSDEIWEYRPGHHKTEHYDKDRVVYLGPQAQSILRPFLLRAADAFCFSPAEAVEEMRRERAAARRTPLSCGNKSGSNQVRHKPRRKAGERYTPQSYNYAVRRACDKAFPVPAEIADDPQEVKKWRASHRWHPNQLRHSLASKVRREFGLDAARTLLGHADQP